MNAGRQRARRRPGQPLHERVIERGLLGCALISIATTAAILVVLLGESFAFFREVPLSAFLLDDQWTPLFSQQHFGIWPLVVGTLLTSTIAIAVALPFGLLAAIYLGELARPRVRTVLKPTLELLAGVPTIVYGYFALVVVTPALQQVVPGLAGFNALGAGIVMGVMIIPMITSLGEDAMAAVPRELREGAFALGAGRLACIFRVVLPTALPGITAALLLAVSRAVGETMIVAIAAGQQPRVTLDPRVPVETMTAYIVQVGIGDASSGTLAYRTIFVIGATLFAFTFAANLLSRRLTRRNRARVATGAT
ncbi:MAG: phosphate ABC transporter permease subunit PstC [Deltaproteobacteria bacterium]|nr:phosphate ABC transporter permease subunit PstC [Deltaproteobacteria bacterium]MBK8238836.1 phosphate ABC transporter permease subunit PstC [Deltaproteobacteria bacterium]MBP7288202.1 phosphate ABC transporter permease subunit PstC [Nannocystaceae bacterium]